MDFLVEQIDQREMLIQNRINEFLKEKNKPDVYSLTEDEEIQLVNYIRQFKKSLDGNLERQAVDPWVYASSYNLQGLVFATLDSRTSGIEHGHAGIGFSSGGNVIEANPGDGVKLYKNRVNNYWSSVANGGIYSVKGATSNDYLTAASYAAARLGRGYGFNPAEGTFYCSELVYYAWKEAGKNIASSRIWGTLILPSQIMNDGDTILQVSFPFSRLS